MRPKSSVNLIYLIFHILCLYICTTLIMLFFFLLDNKCQNILFFFFLSITVFTRSQLCYCYLEVQKSFCSEGSDKIKVFTWVVLCVC